MASFDHAIVRTENRIGQLTQTEPGEEAAEAGALDAKLGGGPRDGVIALLRLLKRAWVQGSLGHAKPFLQSLALFGVVHRHDSILTPRFLPGRPACLMLEIWISKLPSYTMLPAYARARLSPDVDWFSVASELQLDAFSHHGADDRNVAH
jgi:hypothetical protein